MSLVDDCRTFAPNVEPVPHGVEWEHFARAALEPPPQPRDLADASGPILGFFGLIHDWIDQDLLLARALPDALIGRQPSTLRRCAPSRTSDRSGRSRTPSCRRTPPRSTSRSSRSSAAS